MKKLLPLFLVILFSGCSFTEQEEQSNTEEAQNPQYEHEGEIPENGEELFYELAIASDKAMGKKFSDWLQYDKKYESEYKIEGMITTPLSKADLKIRLSSFVDRSDLIHPNVHFIFEQSMLTTSFGDFIRDFSGKGQMIVLDDDLYILAEELNFLGAPTPDSEEIEKMIMPHLMIWKHIILNDLKENEEFGMDIRELLFWLYGYFQYNNEKHTKYGTDESVMSAYLDEYEVFEVLPIENNMYRFIVTEKPAADERDSEDYVPESMAVKKILFEYSLENPEWFSGEIISEIESPIHPGKMVEARGKLAHLENYLSLTGNADFMDFSLEAKKNVQEFYDYTLFLDFRAVDLKATFFGEGKVGRNIFSGNIKMEKVFSGKFDFKKTEDSWSGDLFVYDDAENELAHLTLNQFTWDAGNWTLAFDLETTLFSLQDILVERTITPREDLVIEAPEEYEEMNLPL